jgi:tripartite-type tricarboxylate transporter receptor subunit TctC
MNKALSCLVGAFALASLGATAADYPSKPITLIIPFAAGGSNDIVGRAIGKKLSEALGQPVVIDNRVGAGGVIAATAVAGAAPDGHTLLLVSSTFTINPAIKSSVPFDTVKDFTPVAFIARSPLLVTAAKNLPANSTKELIALAKSKPGAINYASSGPGSINQVAAELLAISAGVKLMHVPYKGGSLALNDLVGGHVDIYISSLPQVLEIVRNGQAKGLAVTSLRRTPSLPSVPTLDESGVPGFDAASWWGIVGPADLPPQIVGVLNTEINKTLTSAEMKKFLDGEGAEAVSMTPQEFGDLIRSETQRWIKVAREANIRID